MRSLSLRQTEMTMAVFKMAEGLKLIETDIKVFEDIDSNQQ
jgi:hypothetical protein